MAFSAFLTKASCETEYQRPSFSADESVFEPKIVAEEPESKDNKFEEILALKQKANEIRVQIEELRLKQEYLLCSATLRDFIRTFKHYKFG